MGAAAEDDILGARMEHAFARAPFHVQLQPPFTEEHEGQQGHALPPYPDAGLGRKFTGDDVMGLNRRNVDGYLDLMVVDVVRDDQKPDQDGKAAGGDVDFIALKEGLFFLRRTFFLHLVFNRINTQKKRGRPEATLT